MSTPPSIASQLVGRKLAGRYLLESVLGTGGVGTVYKARDEQSGSVLAIKMLQQLGPASDDFQQRFFDEALITGQLFHPNIVQVIGFERDEDGSQFLIMELLRGQDLYDVLRERERLPLAKTLEIVRQVASALHAAHNLGVVHRDVKPSNIFLARHAHSEGGEVEVVKVLDFGLSRDLSSQSLRRTAPGTIVGTMEYVAPEGTTGESEHVDFRSDQWALAVVTYRMLAGRLPFDAKGIHALMSAIQTETPSPLRTHAPDVPDHVVAAIERAMAKKKEDRFESVPDFVRALHGLPPLRQAIRGPVNTQRFGRLGAVKVMQMTPMAAGAAAPTPALATAGRASPTATAPAKPAPTAAPAAAAPPRDPNSGEYSVHLTSGPASAHAQRSAQRALVVALVVVSAALLAVLVLLAVLIAGRRAAPLPPASPISAASPTSTAPSASAVPPTTAAPASPAAAAPGSARDPAVAPGDAAALTGASAPPAELRPDGSAAPPAG
jgi:serine/threonine-protein kinase